MANKYNRIKPTKGLLRSSTPDESELNSMLPGNNDNDRYVPRIQRDKPNEDDFQDYFLNKLQINDAQVQEVEIEHAPAKPQAFWEKTAEIPRWGLLVFSNFFILFMIVTFCVVFAYRLSTVGYNQSCLDNSNCNSYVGLTCVAGTCSCSSLQFWNGRLCVAKRTFNRSCTDQSQCDSSINLYCRNVSVGAYTDSLCWCSIYGYWTGSACVSLKTFNATCSLSSECNFNNSLSCINGRCDCNSTQFWNYAFCENKRLYGNQCFSNYWCDNTTAGLQCSTQLPTTGTCDCYSNQYWWSGNNTCMPQLPLNSTCTFDYQCLTNLSLSCSTSTTPNTCQCSSNYWYNTTKCTTKFQNGATCNNSGQCDDTLSLYCNTTSRTCVCNSSSYVWDGSECVVRRSIGGACSSDNDCLATQNLICSTSNIWNSTCACPTNYYWNSTSSLCVIKKLWNQQCSSLYECYDGGLLSCMPNAATNTTVCDCSDYTHYWTGFLNNTYTGYCTPKINYGVPSFTCVSSYQCRDYNYVKCISGQCTCNSTYEYWDGTMCNPRLNYSYACNSTSMCRNWPSGPNLQCLVPTGGSTQQCICTTTQYFDYCRDACYTAQGYQAACNITSCYATSMCDQSKSLSCINNTCNCSISQWWNTTSCVPKGTYLATCTTGQNYQCQDYNFLSCIASQCQCSSIMYWSSTLNYCQNKTSYLGSCTTTTQCLTAGGVNLNCVSGQCVCSSGQAWNSGTQMCM